MTLNRAGIAKYKLRKSLESNGAVAKRTDLTEAVMTYDPKNGYRVVGFDAEDMATKIHATGGGRMITPMTSIKEALATALPILREVALTDDDPRYKAAMQKVATALASLESGDARERIARVIDPLSFHLREESGGLLCTVECNEALATADAILATGLVSAKHDRLLGDLLAVIHRDGGHYQSDHGTEKAVADAHSKWADLISRAEHLDEAAIRADERERCAQIAENLPNIAWTRAENAERQAPTRSMQVVIAAAIRAGCDALTEQERT